MADLQLLTGVCILVTGFMELQCGLGAFHWRILVYIAWFSSITHLSGLIAVKDSILRRPWEKYVRLGFSISYLGLLIAATIPVGFFDWADPMIRWRNKIPNAKPGSPALCYFDATFVSSIHEKLWKDVCVDGQCIFDKDPFWWPPASDGLPFHWYYRITETATFQGMTFSLILLVLGYAFRFAKIIPPPSSLCAMFSRLPPIRMASRLIEKIQAHSEKGDGYNHSFRESCHYIFVIRPASTWIVVCKLHVDLLTSMLGELCWLLLLLTWGTIRVLGARMAIGDEDVEKAEAEWTFGQTLPVLLLVGPLLFIARSIATHRSNASMGRQSLLLCQPLVTAFSESEPKQKELSTSTAVTSQNETFQARVTDMHSIFTGSSAGDFYRSETLVDMPRKHYSEHFWAGPCVGIAMVSLSLLAATVFETIIDPERGAHVPRRPTWNFWFHDAKPLPYLLLYHPLICHLCVLVGNCLDYKQDTISQNLKGRRLVRNTIFLACCLCILCSFVTLTLYYPMYSSSYEIYPAIQVGAGRTHVVGFIATAGFYGLYAAGALWLEKRKR